MKWLHSGTSFPHRIVNLALPLALPFIAVTLLGCSGVATTGDKPMQVELDAFSGRTNPQWVLTSQEASEFLNLLQKLPKNQTQSPINQGLGYRGLIVRDNDQGIGGYDEIVIANGVVITKRGNKTEQFTDKNRGLEQWLLQTGKEELDKTVYQQISVQINRK
ncbi:MAG: hypothetical protein VKL59_15050 [Nostocaceae cyanobacterium]|nr:hypothetical protein [Nostocaceae cyanobacterium]